MAVRKLYSELTEELDAANAALEESRKKVTSLTDELAACNDIIEELRKSYDEAREQLTLLSSLPSPSAAVPAQVPVLQTVNLTLHYKRDRDEKFPGITVQEAIARVSSAVKDVTFRSADVN